MATDKVSRKRMISPSIADTTTDEETFHENSNQFMDSDDSDEEYCPATKRQINVGKRCTTAAASSALKTDAAGKRLKSLHRNYTISSSTDAGGNEKKSIERQPTRRPNPKIHNRNALMARENRRKKKEHLATLEHDVEVFRMENHSLKKSLKSQSLFVQKLKQEQLYLKSVIANKTEIMALLKTIKGNKIPMTSSVLSFMTDDNESIGRKMTANSVVEEDADHPELNHKSDETVSCYGSGTPSSSTTLSCGEDDIDNDFRQNDGDEDDFDTTYDNWENILNDDTPFIKATTDLINADHSTVLADELLSTVNNEHNYFNNNTIESSHKGDVPNTLINAPPSSSPGICLHLSGGRVSLEFCGTCHKSSQNAWFEEM